MYPSGKEWREKKGITHLFYLYESECESWGGPSVRTFSDTSHTEKVLLLKQGKIWEYGELERDGSDEFWFL